ncbi:MAG: Glycerol-3-phosphate dehydrogenase [Propionibacteriaceae bacterium]|nr:Glycerol-3-phosphate dehydrogenase [Propionibacteriaceae bacterium]
MDVTDQQETRRRRLAGLDVPFDLIVIGGGANGCGIAWDAALRGLRVLLLEKEDFGWATSAWNSRLIHGGLKYLEKYDVRLVRESLREREWMLGAAPHLVTPLRFVLPFYARNAHPKAVLRTGLIAYDVLSYDKSTPRHRIHSAAQTRQLIPGIDSDGLQGSGTYYDGQVPYAERLVVEIALGAAAAGATVLNHARVSRLLVEGGAARGVEFVDTTTGDTHTAYAPAVVNSAGPWVDAVLAGLGTQRAPMMGGTKGTHLVVDPFPGAPLDSAMYYEALTDGRPMMIIPWLGRYIIGATDVRFEGDLDTASIDQEELRYILHETNRIIPGANLSADDVLWSYTGVRPLPYQASGPTGDITRRHIVHHHSGDADRPLAGLFSVIGGKLTTFRALAEHVVDDVLRQGRFRTKRPCPTKLHRLPGAQTADLDRFTAEFRRTSMLPEATGERLLALYGTRAGEIQTLAVQDPNLALPVGDVPGLIAAEIAYSVHVEDAVTLTDVVARRIMTGIGGDLGLSSLGPVAEAVAAQAGWSAERMDREVADYHRYIAKLTRSAVVSSG